MSQSRSLNYYVCVRVYGYLADPTARIEASGFSQSSDVRPDIFTKSALPGRGVALDITVVSAEAAHSGQDCLQNKR